MAIKENADQNALHVVCTLGSFHVILEMFISVLNTISFTNKKTLYEITLEILCYVIICPVVYGVSFDRCTLSSCPMQAWVAPLGPPLISAQLWCTFIGSWTTPTSSRSLAMPFSLGVSLEPWSKVGLIPLEQCSTEGCRSQLINVPVLRGTVLGLIL